ncbi:MAG TPA: response regulator [Patescibacteria group bacterium]|nr:response regulator [Patescibacteria group bacterium]
MKNILVVDNDENITKTIDAALSTNKNYKVDVVYSGQEALDKMREGKKEYDIVLLDLMMPKMSGIEVCEEMIEDDKLKNVPVLIVSALPVNSESFQESQGKFDELDVVKDVLEKPFEVKDLFAKTKNILGE